MKWRTYTLLCLAALIPHARPTEIIIKSPDRKVQVILTDQDALQYRVTIDNREVVCWSRFGIISDGVDLGTNIVLGKPRIQTIKETYPMHGGHAWATNHCRHATIPVQTSQGESYSLDVRAYNDGVALRMRLQAKPGRKIEKEITQWRIAGNPIAWYQTDAWGYEEIFRGTRLKDLKPGTIIALPITFSLDGGGYALITEADVINYCDLAVEVTPDRAFQGYFHAPQNRRGWTTDSAVTQPWRVVLLARNLNDLVNSDLIPNLCPPPIPELRNAEWIKPGRCLWHWWAIGAPPFAEQKQWVDWTKQLGFEYYLVDEGWKDWRDGDKDRWACLREVCEYAKAQGVKIWCWVDSKEIPEFTRRTNFFDRAVAAGVVGVKIDFIPEASVRWINWYEETLHDAAARKLMVNFHGANKPVGRQRTWPNELTRESVRGHEYHIIRYNRTLPPEHNCILPFTRYVIGPGDYTPTVFNPRELRGYTWAHELAQAIIYTSPFLCYADHPTNYLSNPALDVLKSIPATWDETIVLPGSEIGKCVAFARRKGKEWFIGILNGPTTTKLDITLNFLGRGNYHMIKLGDHPERPDAWLREERLVKKGHQISMSIRPAGGSVIYLKPSHQKHYEPKNQ